MVCQNRIWVYVALAFSAKPSIVYRDLKKYRGARDRFHFLSWPAAGADLSILRSHFASPNLLVARTTRYSAAQVTDTHSDALKGYNCIHHALL